MRRVLVADGEQRSSLAAVRSLGRSGLHVEVCSHERHPLAGASRYCSRVHVVPDPAAEPKAYLASVGDVLRQRGVDVFLPMTDATVTISFPFRETHPEVLIPLPSRDSWEEASDKLRLTRLAAGLGIPVPEQVAASTPEAGLEAALELAERVGYPLVLKPSRSAVAGERGVGRYLVQIVVTADELRRGLLAYPAQAYPLLIQERILGTGVGAFLLAQEGRLLAEFSHCRLREKPPTGGVSVLRESVPLRSDLREHGALLLRHLGWSGVAMVEFKVHETTGTPYLMEINGRFWGSLQLAIDAGVDFPNLLVRSACGGTMEPQEKYRVGVRSRWLWGDLDHLLWILRAPKGYRDLDPSLPTRARALARFLVPWRRGQRCEVLRLSDPRPFMRESAEWFRAVFTGS